MIIYNVTVSIEDDIQKEWVMWMQNEHIPEVMETKMFNDYKLCRVISVPDEKNTYSIQYYSESMESYTNYQENYAAVLQKKHLDKFHNKFVAFRTLLEVL